MKNYLGKIFKQSKEYYNFFVAERRKAYEEKKNLPILKRILYSKWLWIGIPSYQYIKYKYAKYQETQLPGKFLLEIKFDKDISSILKDTETKTSEDVISRVVEYFKEEAKEDPNEQENLFNFLSTIEIASKDSRCLGIIGNFQNTDELNFDWPTLYELKSSFENFSEFRKEKNMENMSVSEVSRIGLKTLYLASSVGNGRVASPAPFSHCFLSYDVTKIPKERYFIQNLFNTIKKDALDQIATKTNVPADKIKANLFDQHIFVEELLSLGVLKNLLVNKSDVTVIPLSRYYHSYSKQQLSLNNDSVFNSAVTVPLVHLKGTLGRVSDEDDELDLESFREAMDEIIRKKYGVVLFRISCLGGKINETLYISKYLKKLREREVTIICYVDDVATGGGYFFSSQSDFVYANPFSLVGGMGAHSPNDSKKIKSGDKNEQKILFKKEKENISNENNEEEVISSLQNTSSHSKSLSDFFSFESDSSTKKMVDFYNDHFFDIVSQGRKLRKVDVRNNFSYTIFVGQDAFEKNLVDKVGTLFDSIKLSGNFARMIKSNPLKKRNLLENPKIRHFHLKQKHTERNFNYKSTPPPNFPLESSHYLLTHYDDQSYFPFYFLPSVIKGKKKPIVKS
eukprot:TRINITY_DN1938_c0_g1_i2.p1 TRINITY_DN1938_c0_g1~~TRINITY_DN1938_c0_g1_i2.p1  ORF type:complete len:632 (-),score=201.46 TRINITY_DN1938_c0_g1_i2:209-2080(-)